MTRNLLKNLAYDPFGLDNGLCNNQGNSVAYGVANCLVRGLLS